MGEEKGMEWKANECRAPEDTEAKLGSNYFLGERTAFVTDSV